MAKISLRAYHREIESMIDSGHLEEAIGHCQHILKIHPKDLETYRLMAKAYLEAHRYTDAADLFQRVLFSVPDDFVSHLAMSLIRDEEKNLDAAIWHMERAFEQQPSNAALQAELKRLYGRRDGMEPLKIRLTRGALAQMYAKGDQYAQAIAEIRSVLAEDPDRTDLQVLLARVYFKAGQKVEATEMCNTLLKKYPYNYEANRIMMEILPSTGRADSAQVYRQRVIQLNPYAAFLSESLTNISDVPDNTIMIERFEWDPDAAAGYLSLPETTGQRDAEWMSIPETEQPTAALPAEEDTIPDFLKEAGWGPSTGQFDERATDFGAEDMADSPLGEIAAAELPDWLKSMAPPAEETAALAAQPAAEEETEADLDFLQDLGLPPAPQSALEPSAETLWSEPAETPDWLAALGEAPAPSTPASASTEETPDWLASLGEEPAPSAPTSAPTEETPDWLSALGEAPTPSAPASTTTEESIDWLTGLRADDTFIGQPAAESEATTEGSWAESAETPDWLANLGEEPAPSASSVPESAPASASEEEPLSPIAAGAGISASEQDDAFAWLEALAAKQGAKPEELLTSPEARTEQAPEWVEQAAEPEPAAPSASFVPESAPASASEEEPLSPIAAGAGISASEQDDAFAWLEALAAKQGAKPEELLTSPEARSEQAPAWVEQTAEPEPPAQAASFVPESIPESIPESAPASASEEEPLSPLAAGISASEQDDAFAWLEALAAKQGAKPEELLTSPEARTEQAPEWVEQAAELEPAAPFASSVSESAPASTLETAYQPETPIEAEAEAPQGELSALIDEPGITPQEQDDAMSWLEALAARQGAKPEELLTAPETRREEAPGWVSEVTNRPTQTSPLVSAPGSTPDEQDEALAWLESLAAKQGAKPEELLTHPESRRDEAPEWVEQITAPSPGAESAPTSEPQAEPAETLDWLDGLGEAPAPSESDIDEATKVTEPLTEAAAPAGELPEADSLIEHWQESTAGQPEFAQNAEQPLSVAPETEELPLPPDGVTAWLRQLDAQEAQTQASEPAPVSGPAAWFDTLTDAETRSGAVDLFDDEDIPDWLRSETDDEIAPTPVTPSEWVLEPAPGLPPEAREEAPIEPPAPAPQPVVAEAPAPTAPAEAPRPRPTSYLAADKDSTTLTGAQSYLSQGALKEALQEYNKLIKKGKMLDEVIYDLREATYRYPVDVGVWQALGDAYMRANRLQDALDAFTKAEELLR